MIVCQGGRKATTKFDRLLTSRIDWNIETQPGFCHQIWQGEIADTTFKKFKVQRA
jgi:hypothetical protein